MKQLTDVRYQLEQNLKELNQINSKLNDEIRSLGGDTERIVIQSRDLSYIKDHEKILFMNLADVTVPQFDVGKILHLEIQYDSPEKLLKWISFLLFLSGLVISVIIRKKPI